MDARREQGQPQAAPGAVIYDHQDRQPGHHRRCNLVELGLTLPQRLSGLSPGPIFRPSRFQLALASRLTGLPVGFFGLMLDPLLALLCPRQRPPGLPLAPSLLARGSPGFIGGLSDPPLASTLTAQLLRFGPQKRQLWPLWSRPATPSALVSLGSSLLSIGGHLLTVFGSFRVEDLARPRLASGLNPRLRRGKHRHQQRRPVRLRLAVHRGCGLPARYTGRC